MESLSNTSINETDISHKQKNAQLNTQDPFKENSVVMKLENKFTLVDP